MVLLAFESVSARSVDCGPLVVMGDETPPRDPNDEEEEEDEEDEDREPPVVREPEPDE